MWQRLRSFEDALMPNACVFCGTRCEHDRRPICVGCDRDLPWAGSCCGRCAMPVDTVLPEGVYCPSCQASPPAFDVAIAPLIYAFPLDAAIKAMKFRRKLFYVPAFTAILEGASTSLPRGVDAILPVPLYWHRRALRGFNQAEELSRPLARKLGAPLLRKVSRCENTPYQSGLAADERIRNLHGAFRLRGAVTANHVLIIDDVITTGATSGALARLLKDAGVQQVSVLALARAC